MPFQESYYPNYFSMEDILATQERTPCKVLLDLPKLGKLNTASEDDDLKAGTTLELPIWLVQQLSFGRQPTFHAEIPRVYKEGYREILKADACAVNLHKMGLHFYEVGSYVKRFDARGDISTILVHTFQNRFKQLMDTADNIGSDPTVQDQLDTLECRLFKDGHAARTRLNTWLVESVAPLETASMVVNHKNENG